MANAKKYSLMALILAFVLGIVIGVAVSMIPKSGQEGMVLLDGDRTERTEDTRLPGDLDPDVTRDTMDREPLDTTRTR